MSKFGWSRSNDSQFLNIVQNVLSGRRQQFAVLISGRDEVQPIGDMVSAYDAVYFDKNSARAVFADDLHVVEFDLKNQQRLNVLELNGLIVVELSKCFDGRFFIHVVDGSEHRLGLWDVNKPTIDWCDTVKDAPVSWGIIAIDLPHSETQTYAAQDLGIQTNDRTVEGFFEDFTQSDGVALTNTTYPGSETLPDEDSKLNDLADGDTVETCLFSRGRQPTTFLEEDHHETVTSPSNGASDGKSYEEVEIDEGSHSSIEAGQDR